MDYIYQIIEYGVEGYKIYETKEFAREQLSKIYKIITLFIISYFLYKIIRG